MKSLLLIAALLLGGPSLASADENEPPPFPAVIPPDGKVNTFEHYVHLHPEKLTNGRTRLIMWGGIQGGDAERFRDAVESSKPISELVIIGSPGGLLDEGIKIGRIIRINKLSTRIAPGAQCVSACNFVFLGGVIRSIDPGGKFITHVFSRSIAPVIMLADEIEAAKETREELAGTGTESNPPPGGTNKPPATSVSAKPPAADTVSKIGVNQYLEALGCKINEMYTPDYDHETVVPNEILLEHGLNSEKIPKDAKVQDPVQLARLRALYQDYLCVEEGAAHDAAEIATFLVEMRLSLRFLTQFSQIANALPRPMTKDELRDFNIVNTE